MKSHRQIVRERQEWARGKLIRAWFTITKALESPNLTPEKFKALDEAMHHASAIATEWGLNPRDILEELAQPRKTGTKAG